MKGNKPAPGRCGHCRRRIDPTNVIGVTHDWFVTEYCGARAACRRAAHGTHGEQLKTSGASDEALGAAMIAADYVSWPWWGRLLTRNARDGLAGEMATCMSAAVEHRCSKPAPAGPEGDEQAARDAIAERAYARTGTPCCCLDPGADCPACLTGRHYECLENPERETGGAPA